MGDTEEPTATIGRRGLLAGAAIGGAAVAGGIAGGVVAGSTGSSGGWRREALVLEVALLGNLWRDVPIRNPAGPDDFRAPFLVEGHIYPEGTVGDGFVPSDAGSIGRWFCQGWSLVDASRPEPHVSSRQTYVLGAIGADRLFPPDTLISQGIEGSNDESQIAPRAIGGGTGKYMGATGQVAQRLAGTNTTVFDDGSDDPAPNFVFTFDLLLPDL